MYGISEVSYCAEIHRLFLHGRSLLVQVRNPLLFYNFLHSLLFKDGCLLDFS